MYIILTERINRYRFNLVQEENLITRKFKQHLPRKICCSSIKVQDIFFKIAVSLDKVTGK